jgi:serine/threonine-protein kinase
LCHDARESSSCDIVGTPAYMAPEQAKGDTIDKRVDVYGIGAVLYECLTGRPPFQADTVFNTLAQITKDDPVAPRHLQPGVPLDLETICLKCLEKDPASR